MSFVIIISVVSIGFSGAATAAGPSISSVDFPDPSFVGTETTEVRVSGTVDTGFQYNHYLVLYEKNPNNFFEGETKVNTIQFTPSDSSFQESLEFEIPNDENGEDHEYQVKLVQQDTISIGSGNTSVRSGIYNEFVTEPDSEDPDPQMISTDERSAGDSYIYYGGNADPRETTTYDINDPPTIRPGETVTIYYYVRNEGGTAGEFSAIQIQFKSLDQQSDDEQFSIFSGGLNKYTIAPGDTVYNKDGTEHDDGASSWQFERGLDFVIPGSEHGFSADVTPEEAGEFTVLVRATYTDDTAQGADNQFSTEGSARDPDQNGYTMKEINFNVEARNEPPTADSGGPYNVEEGGSVTLDASGSIDPDGDIDSESWTVTSGDGFISGEMYYAPDDITSDDTATVELTVEDDDEATDSELAQITINDNNQPPNPEANGKYMVDESSSVTLDSTGTSDPDGTVVTESWAVVNGPGSISGATYEAPTDITEEKTATVELTAEDDDDDASTDDATVTIVDDNQPPTARAGGPYSVGEGGSVTLDDSSSTDSDGSIASTSWKIISGDGSVSGGTYSAPDDITSDSSATAELTVEDDDQATDTDTASIAISDDNQPPTADAGGSYSVSEGNSVNLDASGSNDPDGSIQSRSWAVTNGPGTISGGTYQAPDDINNDIEARVQLTVVDDDGTPGTDTTTVSVGFENAAPTASDMDVSTEQNSPVSKTFSASDPDDDSLSYTIESTPSDGTVSVSGDSFTYTPESISSGTDSFVYRVDDGNGGTDTATVTIDVSISQDVVDEYDTNGEPGIQIEELNTGIDDYFIDEISIQELNTLIDAYFQQV
jgi:hypothetical protein